MNLTRLKRVCEAGKYKRLGQVQAYIQLVEAKGLIDGDVAEIDREYKKKKGFGRAYAPIPLLAVHGA